MGRCIADLLELDLFAFARSLGQPLQQVRTQLRELETRHELVVKASELSSLVELKKSRLRACFS